MTIIFFFFLTIMTIILLTVAFLNVRACVCVHPFHLYVKHALNQQVYDCLFFHNGTNVLKRSAVVQIYEYFI